MTSPTRGAVLGWPGRIDCTLWRQRSEHLPPQEGVEQVMRSMATNRAQVEPSVLVSDVLHEAWDARTSPARALVAPVEASAEGREGWGWRRRSWARHNWGSHSRLHGRDARTCKLTSVRKLSGR